MKKLLGIVVLGLLLCNVGFAEIITLKCVITEMEVGGKDKNEITGETHASQESDQFFKIDTNDNEALKTDLMYIWVHISKGGKRDSTDKYVSYETINRYDLKRYEKTILVDEETANNYKTLWEKGKNDLDVFNEIYRSINTRYIHLSSSDDIEDFTMSQNHNCEMIEKKF
tara:strand:- start:66 stop:575 length:510 start_codon:yes stop_codon:yes gene_type:complete